jgi:hypothetical protein
MSQTNVTLVSVKRGQKGLQAEFKGVIVKQGMNPLALMNEGDSRFTQDSTRHAWLTVNAASINKIFNVSLDALQALKEGESLELNLVAPKYNGVPFQIQVVESLSPFNEWEAENWKKAAKQLTIDEKVVASARISKTAEVDQCLGQQGYFTKEGRLIFSKAVVVLQDVAPIHTFIEGSVLSSTREAEILFAANLKVADKVAENAPVTAKEVSAEI